MKRRIVVVGALLVVCASAMTAQAAEPPKILFLSIASLTSNSGTALSIDSFRTGLRDLGYVEGQTIVIDYGFANGDAGLLPGVIAERIKQKPSVVVALGAVVAQAVKTARLQLPVVTVSADMVGSGLVASLARPGGNITGVSLGVEGSFGGKWLELIKEVAPRANRVAYLWNPANRGSALEWHEIQVAAPKLGLAPQSVTVGAPEDVAAALAAIAGGLAEAIIVDPDQATGFHRAEIIAFAAANRLPLISVFRGYPEAGALASYGPKLRDIWRRAATYVDKILKGARPADLPVEQPTTFELVINLKTAKALGLTIPPALLARADEVIE
jgi:putative ABC transport system substrate-binding protein